MNCIVCNSLMNEEEFDFHCNNNSYKSKHKCSAWISDGINLYKYKIDTILVDQYSYNTLIFIDDKFIGVVKTSQDQPIFSTLEQVQNFFILS